MMFRAPPVSIGIAAMLTVASVCLAAETGPVVTSPSASPGPGRGSLGALIGGSWFAGTGDYSEGAQPRLSFSGNFRYQFSKNLRWQVSPGFTWAAYSTGTRAPFVDLNFPADTVKGGFGVKDRYLTLMIPVSAQLQIVVGKDPWRWHAGVGPGVYRVWVEDRRKVLKDPLKLRLHRGVYPGVTGQIGFERFLKALPSTSIECSAAGHWVFSEHADQFPSGFNSNVLVAELRIGANYTFRLDRGGKPKATALPGEAK